MRRKALGLIAAAACGMLLAPLGVAAQQPNKIFRVGVLALADNQLTRFSAKALGVTLPPAIMVRADEVIQ